MMEGKCEVCEKVTRVAVVCVPGVPHSAAYCEECLTANAHPWGILVANTACCNGLAHTHEGWRKMVHATCAHLGKTLEQFESEVSADMKLLDEAAL